MWFIIILIIAVVIIFILKKRSDKIYAEQLEQEKIEQRKKAAEKAKIQKSKLEVITEAEKQKLSAQGENILSTTLNAFDKATKGDTTAMLLMGITYQAKIQNPQKAAYWMQKSSNAGNVDALYWLGEFYVSGYGVQENRVKGVSMIIDAAKKGNKDAIQSLKENGMSLSEMRSVGIPV